uniref:F-box domain-containing protein n=1 Tax=Meloidogyne enterolobii TaxID=390850 RepID=A0A6V7TV04_MELEN|nr:unnamed protein product [Meloidogyne enterolobii]
MLSLPPEVQLDVLKCLNFEQLFSFKQTNSYFYNLINKYEGGLARMEFSKLSFIDAKAIDSEDNKSFVFIKIEPIVSSTFVLSDQLMKKWKAAIAESVPLILYDCQHDTYVYDVYLKKKVNDKHKYYTLKLPNIPKTTEEMIVVRDWLEQLFKCAFVDAVFENVIFNPEMINLLFDEDKTIVTKFHIRDRLYLTAGAITFENIFKLALNNFAIYQFIAIGSEHVCNVEKYTDIVFKIIINEGNKFPRICFNISMVKELYDLITEHIITSKDLSKMVTSIVLNCNSSTNFKLNERAEKVEKLQEGLSKVTKYQIANIYNPKVKFSFCHPIDMEGFCLLRIKRMEEQN